MEPLTEEEQRRRLSLYRLVYRLLEEFDPLEGDSVTIYRGLLSLIGMLASPPPNEHAADLQEELREQLGITRTAVATRA